MYKSTILCDSLNVMKSSRIVLANSNSFFFFFCISFVCGLLLCRNCYDWNASSSVFARFLYAFHKIYIRMQRTTAAKSYRPPPILSTTSTEPFFFFFFFFFYFSFEKKKKILLFPSFYCVYGRYTDWNVWSINCVFLSFFLCVLFFPTAGYEYFIVRLERVYLFRQLAITGPV